MEEECPSSRKVVDRDSTKLTKSKLQLGFDLGLKLKRRRRKRTGKSLEFGTALAVIHHQLTSTDSRERWMIKERSVETDLLPPQLISQEVDVTSEERWWKGETERNQTLDGPKMQTGRWQQQKRWLTDVDAMAQMNPLTMAKVIGGGR